MASPVSTLRRLLELLRVGVAVRRLRRRDVSEQADARRALAGMLADARGLTMKIGQTLAGTDPESPFRELVAGADPLPLERMLPVLERSLGRPVDELFASFGDSATAGSLGQVHLATLRDGRDVAVKIQYPGVAAVVEAELRLAGLTPTVGPVKRWGFDLPGYKHILRDNMRRELDYRSEADRQQRMRETVAVPGLRIPRIIEELSSERVLTQERVQGVLLDQAAVWPLEDRMRVGRTLLEAFFKSLLVLGEVHGDPNVGNTLFSKTDEGTPLVALVDFGCTVPVSVPRRLSLLKLILDLRDHGSGNELATLAGLGFDADRLARIGGRLPAVCRILFRPLCVDGPFDLKTWHVTRELTELLGDDRWWFRSAGPPDLLLLVRAFNGLVTQLTVLDVELPWWPILVAAVGEDLLSRARAFVPPRLPAGIERRAAEGQGSPHRLKVEVVERDTPILDLTLPAEAVRDVGVLIPAHVRASLPEEDARRLDELSHRFRDGEIEPMTLFDSSRDGRRYRIWLE